MSRLRPQNGTPLLSVTILSRSFESIHQIPKSILEKHGQDPAVGLDMTVCPSYLTGVNMPGTDMLALTASIMSPS